MTDHGTAEKSEMPSMTTVAEACTAFHNGMITERELTDVLVAFAPVNEPPVPDAPWYDAVVSNDGPISELDEAVIAGLIAGPTYERVIRAMLDAGHEA